MYAESLAAWVPASPALSEAQTVTVRTVILFQIFYMLNCLSLQGSILKIGFFSSVTVFIGVGVLLLLQVAFILFPFLRGVFGSSLIEPHDLWLATLVGASVLPIVSLVEWWRSRADRHA